MEPDDLLLYPQEPPICHLLWARQIQYMPYSPISIRSILLSSYLLLGLPSTYVEISDHWWISSYLP
jgi:hypothetical protein